MTARTNIPVTIGAGILWRATAVMAAAALLALSATFISGQPIETQAAGSPGSAWAWGSSVYGQLGNGANISSSTPIPSSLPPGTTVTAVAGGTYHSLALTSTGQVLAWGYNFHGQLGNGTATTTGCFCSSTPVAVSLPSGTTVTAIAAGRFHSLALTSTGRVFAWGYNNFGNLGNGTTADSSTPVAVSMPIGITITAIAAGAHHNLALTAAGYIFSWGYNSSGQLGNSTTANSSTPYWIGRPPPGDAVTALAAGYSHSLALTATGKVFGWGRNVEGQLGTGNTTSRTSAVAVGLPPGTTVSAIAAGASHSLALTSANQVFAWGLNSAGQLGDGTTTTTTTPLTVSLPSGTNVTALAGGASHSLALTSTSKVLAWGDNSSGQLGNGTTTNSSAPIVVSAFPSVLALAAGGSHSLAITIQMPAVAVFPAMTNGAYGGYVTATTIQNIGVAPAIARIVYFNQSGAPVGIGDYVDNLPVNASWTVRQDSGSSFPSAGGNSVQAGSAIIYSSQPLASFVNEFAPGNTGDATSYTGVQVPSGVGTTLYAPTIVNNAYGGYSTGIGLLNLGNGPTDVTITYRDSGGNVVKTQILPALEAHAYQALYSGDTKLALPSGFVGTATITDTGGQPLGAIVNETGPGGQFSSYDAVPSGSKLLNLPVALNNAFGGYYTGMAIQNISGSLGTVTVNYYDASGTATVKNFAISAFGSLGVYQGSATDGPAPGAYTAVIQSSLLLAAIVNEVAPAGAGSSRQSTSYNALDAGSQTLRLPLVENAGSDPWNTGLGIMNTGATGTAVQVNYYYAATGAAVGITQTQYLAPHAFWGLYQPTGGLPAGSRATAVVTTSAGGQVAVVCNESSPTTFMSYNGQ